MKVLIVDDNTFPYVGPLEDGVYEKPTPGTLHDDPEQLWKWPAIFEMCKQYDCEWFEIAGIGGKEKAS